MARDVMRETQDFAATREALRRAVTGENDPDSSKATKADRASRKAGRKRR
jgi:hypothetical protein